jgi:hypothetical protein
MTERRRPDAALVEAQWEAQARAHRVAAARSSRDAGCPAHRVPRARLGAVTEELIRLARWLETQPWNRPGSDKAWVLRAHWSGFLFSREVQRAVRAVAR